MDIAEIKAQLPSEWDAEHYPHGRDLFVLKRPQAIGGGFVTVDFGRRIFNIGMGQPRSAVYPGKTYRGRGWQRELVTDAVAYLNVVWA